MYLLLLTWFTSIHFAAQQDTKVPPVYCHRCTVKGPTTSASVLKDRLAKEEKGSERNVISSQDLPYIVLPPDNAIPDNPKKILYIGTTPHPPLFDVVAPTAAPHANVKASTPVKPVNINIVLPTSLPKPPTLHPNVIHETVNPNNETRIDLNLNIDEQNRQLVQQPIVIKLAPTTPLPRVIVPRQQPIVSQTAASIGQQMRLLSPPYGDAPDSYAPARMPSADALASANMIGRSPLPNFPNQGVQPPYSMLSNSFNGLTNTYPNYFASTPQMLDQLTAVISSAIKSSIAQSQPELITSALTKAAMQTQTVSQPSELLSGALTQALANVVGQNNQISEEQKLTKNLAAALNMLKSQTPPTPPLPQMSPVSNSPLKVEVVNLPNQYQPANPNSPLSMANQNQPANSNYPFNMPYQNQPGNLGYPVNAPNMGNPIYSPASPPLNPGYYPNQVQPLIIGQLPGNTPQALPTTRSLSQQDSRISIDKVSANSLGKAMAKALVDSAKKIASEEHSGIQRDTILKSKYFKGIPKKVINFFRNTLFRHPRRMGHRFGPLSAKYLKHLGKCHCCCCYC